MPGKLLVLGRSAPRSGWSLLGVGLSAAEASDMVAAFLEERPKGRALVANVVRSLTTTSVMVEDAVPTLDP